MTELPPDPLRKTASPSYYRSFSNWCMSPVHDDHQPQNPTVSTTKPSGSCHHKASRKLFINQLHQVEVQLGYTLWEKFERVRLMDSRWLLSYNAQMSLRWVYHFLSLPNSRCCLKISLLAQLTNITLESHEYEPLGCYLFSLTSRKSKFHGRKSFTFPTVNAGGGNLRLSRQPWISVHLSKARLRPL